MYNLTDIKSVHLELTTKCQARCPMCPRRLNGGPLNPLFELEEIDLDTFKKWFPRDFIIQLDRLFMCGNLGDPIIAQDCIEILQYIRNENPNIMLSMHTNGSARNKNFWLALAQCNVKVTFGIDGLEDTHKLYRIDTDFDKIIDNAAAFISAGGQAEWHMLVFDHNEHQVGACQHMADMMGFKKFVTKHTSRFKDNKFNVIDETGKTSHILKPTERSKEIIIKLEESKNDQRPYVSCKAQKNKEIYVSATGVVTPCCWLDLSWMITSHDNRIDYMDKVSEFPNLRDKSLEEIFNSNYFTKIESTWDQSSLFECKKQCGSFDKLGAQFAN